MPARWSAVDEKKEREEKYTKNDGEKREMRLREEEGDWPWGHERLISPQTHWLSIRKRERKKDLLSIQRESRDYIEIVWREKESL